MPTQYGSHFFGQHFHKLGITASGMLGADADASHTADTLFHLCHLGIGRINGTNGTLPCAQAATGTIIICHWLERSAVKDLIGSVTSRQIKVCTLICIQPLLNPLAEGRQLSLVFSIGASRGILAENGMFRHCRHRRNASETKSLQCVLQLGQGVLPFTVAVHTIQHRPCPIAFYSLQALKGNSRHSSAIEGN